MSSTDTTKRLHNGTALQQAFHAGLAACLRTWSALKTAVESGWGGSPQECYSKAEDLRVNILQYFDFSRFPAALSQEDLEDNLAIYLEEEFCVTLQDDSEKQVAQTICSMYEDCYCKGDTSLVERVVAAAQQHAVAAAAYPVRVESMCKEHDEDSDDDVEMIDNGNTPMGSAEKLMPSSPAVAKVMTLGDFAKEPLFGPPTSTQPKHVPAAPVRQLGETDPVADTAAVALDEHGFAPVPPKGGRRRKPV